MNFILRLSEIGVKGSDNSEEIKKIVFVNKIAILFIIASLPFTLSILYIKNYFLASLTPITLIGFFSTILFNGLFKFKIAKTSLFFTVLLAVYFFADVLGAAAGIQYVYFTLIMFGFAIFDRSERSLRYCLPALPIICFYSLHFTNYSLFNITISPSSNLLPIYLTSTLLIFIISWLIVFFYDQSSIDNKQNLKRILLSYHLTDREGDILLLLLNGKNNKKISAQLFIEEGTVKNHLTNIYKKLNVKNRTELMAKFTD